MGYPQLKGSKGKLHSQLVMLPKIKSMPCRTWRMRNICNVCNGTTDVQQQKPKLDTERKHKNAISHGFQFINILYGPLAERE